MIVVTGSTGHLGRLVIESLLKKVPAGQIVAAVRSPEKAQDLAALGVVLREGDYNRPETLAAAFAGAEKVLLISSNDIEKRVSQHKAAIDAAKAAGVKLVAYTGILNSTTSTLKLAADHKATEEYLAASGLEYVFLRDGWYFENHTASLGAALEHGAIIGAAGDGRFSAAARADYAEAAAVVLTTEGHASKAYELGGDTSFTYSELAAEVSAQSGKPVAYAKLTEEAYAAALMSFGLPAELAAILADADAQAAHGELETKSRDLSTLIGRPTTTLKQAVADALKG
jgi:NAD(P)H dehydrogenase (quinone)